MKDSCYEKMMHIETAKAETRMDSNKHYNRYEPSSYKALDTLFKKYEANEEDHFVDFGSGKGRFSFFVNFFYGSGSTGVEIVEEFHKDALSNLESYKKKNPKASKLFFVNTYAEKYKVSKFENKFYFFNPFSLNIFISVVNEIITSVEEEPRVVDIILYYPTFDYTHYLDTSTGFELLMEVPLEKYSKDLREKFSIYRLSTGYDYLDLDLNSYLYTD